MTNRMARRELNDVEMDMVVGGKLDMKSWYENAKKSVKNLFRQDLNLFKVNEVTDDWAFPKMNTALAAAALHV